jgi:hypothetical protein
MTKYKQYFQRMLEVEKELFENFRIIHDNYALNPQANQDEFNKEGERVLQVIRLWENKLCSQSEKAGYASFTSNLSEKFRQEIKKVFPEIDNIGLVGLTTKDNSDKEFVLKKINLL